MITYEDVLYRLFGAAEEFEDLVTDLKRENDELKEQLGPGSVLAHLNRKKLVPEEVLDRFFGAAEDFEDLVIALKRENDELAHSNRKKLGPEEVQGIRTLKRLGWTNKSIAETYDVNPATVSRIIRGIYHK